MTTVPGPAPQWITLKGAQRIAGCGAAVIYRHAVYGNIATDITPGCPPRYLRRDVERLAAARQSQPVPAGA